MQRSLFDFSEEEPSRTKRLPDALIADARKRHPDMVLLFHVGDFYELFDQDATLAAQLLGLPTTRKSGRKAKASFPATALEPNLRKLLNANHRVAICESTEETP
jgi:DNA mismatch repair protein MutS